METDLDIRDDFHGTEGPVPVLRRQKEDWAAIQRAFYLRVADASIIPYVTRANTNATAIMIGEKLADWIKQGQ
jgi:choline dehydrogenase